MSCARFPAPSVPLPDLRVVSLPEEELVDRVSARVPGFRCVLWDMARRPGRGPCRQTDVAVGRYFTGRWIGVLPAATRLRLVQLQSTGFDVVPEAAGPALGLSTAGWGHAAGTAEPALGLMTAARRERDRAALRLRDELWRRFETRSLADCRVLVPGVGEEEVVSGRLRCALDVVHPELFPGDRPLVRAPGALPTPPTGGSSTSCRPRVRRLLQTQLERIAAGRRPMFLQQEGRLDVRVPRVPQVPGRAMSHIVGHGVRRLTRRNERQSMGACNSATVSSSSRYASSSDAGPEPTTGRAHGPCRTSRCCEGLFSCPAPRGAAIEPEQHHQPRPEGQ
ncbi:hypothetical protein [Kocuria nitroreducens]|uniref:hypothetical protein n=1 Tax=Kocuria nitroreducens TaxID=3058914 RepID=UPI0036D82FF1